MSNSDNKIIEELQAKDAKIEELLRQLAELKGEKTDIIENARPKINIDNISNEDEVFDYNEYKFEDDYGIKVMSLCDCQLNIRTGKMGNQIFTFEKYGQIRYIPYVDMCAALRYSDKFYIQSRYSILDLKFCLKFSLKQDGLSKAQLDLLYSGNLSETDMMDLVKLANKNQLDQIVRHVIELLASDNDRFTSLFIKLLEKYIKLNLWDLVEQQEIFQEVVNSYKV